MSVTTADERLSRRPCNDEGPDLATGASLFYRFAPSAAAKQFDAATAATGCGTGRFGLTSILPLHGPSYSRVSKIKCVWAHPGVQLRVFGLTQVGGGLVGGVVPPLPGGVLPPPL